MSGRTPTRERIVELDKRHVWHPYTPMKQYIEETEPLVVDRADEAFLFDVDGKKLIDGNSSWWTALLGHRHPRLLGALHAQADKLCHAALAGATHENAALLAEALVERSPDGLSRVFYSDDGSTAVEVALQMAIQYWAQNGRPERTRFIALDGAFHGETLGVVALGGVEVFRRPFAGVLMECVHVPASPDGHARAFAALEEALTQGADTIAAVVLEPMVQGAGGMRIYDAAYLRHARELTKRHDTFLVLDEVFTGYGRTGPMWASEHAGVTPDAMCIAKGFTAGILPMAATLATERLFEGFLGDADRAFYYGHTYCGHALGSAIAREVLAVYDDEAILERAREKAALIRECFAELGNLPAVENARSLGMVGALNLGGGSSYLEKAGWRVYDEALRRGAYLRPLGNVVYTVPPLNIANDVLEQLLGILDESVRVVVG